MEPRGITDDIVWYFIFLSLNITGLILFHITGTSGGFFNHDRSICLLMHNYETILYFDLYFPKTLSFRPVLGILASAFKSFRDYLAYSTDQKHSIIFMLKTLIPWTGITQFLFFFFPVFFSRSPSISLCLTVPLYANSSFVYESMLRGLCCLALIGRVGIETVALWKRWPLTVSFFFDRPWMSKQDGRATHNGGLGSGGSSPVRVS